MNRRQLLRYGATGAALIGVGAVAAFYTIDEAAPDTLTIASVLKRLDAWQDAASSFSGSWSAYQVFTHMAQSVEYSMTGYPELKSDLFRQTAGPLAYAVFSAKGRMRHNLVDPIPGAPALTAEGDVQQALMRFRQALLDFDAFSSDLKPHFAYGDLSRSDYALAHVMHFNDHMRALEPVGSLFEPQSQHPSRGISAV